MLLIAFIPVLLYLFLEFARRDPIKEAKKNRGSSMLIGSVFAWMFIIPTIIHLFVHVWVLPTYTIAVGVFISFGGVWIRYAAMAMLGRFYSRNVGIQEKHELIQTGWYRLIRHPGYLGTCLTFLGFALATASSLSVLFDGLLFFSAYTYRIRVEETALVAHFGDAYVRYQQKTWRLIPFIY